MRKSRDKSSGVAKPRLLTRQRLRGRKAEVAGDAAAETQSPILEVAGRRQTQAELERSESLLVESQRIAHLGSWEWDLKTNVLFWSKETYRLFGVTPETFTPTIEGFAAFVHPDDRAFVNKSIRDAIHHHASYDLNHRIVLADGQERVIHEQGRVLYDDHGRPARTLGTAWDITDRKKAEELLRKSAEQIEDLYNKAPCGYHSLDKHGVVIRINDTELSWLGYSRKELVGHRYSEFLTPASRKTFRAEFARFVRRGWVRNQEFDLLQKCGSILPVVVNATAIRDKFGALVMSRTTVNDITERREAQRKVETYQARLQLLAAEMAKAEHQERQRVARILHDNHQQLLVAAKIRTTHLAMELPQGNLRSTAEQVKAILDEAIAGSRSLAVELSPPVLQQGNLTDALRWLARWMEEQYALSVKLAAPVRGGRMDEGVRVELFHAVRELLFNVVKHAKANAATVAMQTSKKQVQIVISDNGVGFDAERALNNANGMGGMGLFSITERLERMGGKVILDSAAGRGTRITLRMPLTLTATREKPIARSHLSRKRRRSS